jgi:hypothetical protein
MYDLIIREKKWLALAGGITLAALALVTGGMSTSPHWPARMSGLRVDGMAGYTVVDPEGQSVGKVLHVDTDAHHRTRYIAIALDDGGSTRLASFQAFVDPRIRQVELVLPRDAVLARAAREAEQAKEAEPKPEAAVS